ncbi:alpha/beta hydrolase fold domain-containing protein [Mycobacterium sp. Marseille-P9652]|uniref:alpha/beta hydrolase fold domain-containing protein n=1 Tax=Mycobacterium sp. Marseille-P9652 TaxID=2654950 RepID=UPI0012E7B44E|nr:alpha/beta hydrolase fold domain-containing protein [Mycobacterium sp. Marseille-P9652]
MRQSWGSRALPVILRLTRGRTYRSAQSARDHVEQRALHPQPFGPPPRLRRDVTVSMERRSGWPVYVLSAEGAQAAHRTVVYLHGGAWVNEIAVPHWRLAAQLAAESRTRVVVPIYPLVPFATAADVVPAVADLVAQQASTDHDVCLAGDSAGGQIALSAALLLRDEHRLILPRTVLISPVLDVSLNNPAIGAVRDPWLTRDALWEFAQRWCGDLPMTNPLVSPLRADLAGLGPLIVFSGTRDILNPDARLLAEKAAAANVAVDFHEAPGLVHVYPLTPTKEGRAARAAIVEALGDR